ncbi:MAG TPA: uroporphyrinogen decarboxylase family protein, partial [Chloroflexota bacterium]|nr:uroporphyrinogen decarboxylase family protein [Chloroflexota bacterium]
RHFYPQERDATLLSEALLAFQREYQWDFVKVNPRGSYHVEDWGNRYSYSNDPHVAPTLLSHVVHSREDWGKIQRLDIWKSEALKQQLVLLELVKEGLQNENVYFLQTIFSPLAIAFKLAGSSKDRLQEAMKSESKELKAALEAIAESYVDYATASLNVGASGIFFATTKMASAEMMSEEQYAEFGTPYDLRVLAAVQSRLGFNLLHMCEGNIFFDRLMGYPVDAISWDVTLPGNPSLRKGRERSGKMVVGGLDSMATFKTGKPDVIDREVTSALQETGGRGCAIAPGCTFPTMTRGDLLEAALAARERFSGN